VAMKELKMACAFLPLLVSLSFTALPIEQALTESPFTRTFPWYVPWRGAVVSLIIWLFLIVVYTSKKEMLDYLLWGACASFTTFHYAQLYVVLSLGFSVKLFPLLYAIGPKGREILYLDLGQIAILVTALVSYPTRRKILNTLRLFFTLRRPPRAYEGTQQSR